MKNFLAAYEQMKQNALRDREKIDELLKGKPDHTRFPDLEDLEGVEWHVTTLLNFWSTTIYCPINKLMIAEITRRFIALEWTVSEETVMEDSVTVSLWHPGLFRGASIIAKGKPDGCAIKKIGKQTVSREVSIYELICKEGQEDF